MLEIGTYFVLRTEVPDFQRFEPAGGFLYACILVIYIFGYFLALFEPKQQRMLKSYSTNKYVTFQIDLKY